MIYQKKSGPDTLSPSISLMHKNKNVYKIGKVCCVKIDEKWRMKSQITIALLILFLMIFVIVISITILNVIYIDKMLQGAQN